MEKKILRETYYSDLNLQEIEEEGKPKRWVIRGEFGVAGKPNANNRIYPIPVVAKAIDKLKQLIAEKKVFGELDHPDDMKLSLQKVSHLITDLKLEGDKIIGEAILLDTPCGQIAKEIIKAGGKIGVSSRGIGSVKKQDGLEVVQDDFELITFDLVANPADEKAYPNIFLEQRRKEEGKDMNENKNDEEIEDIRFENDFLKELLKEACFRLYLEKEKIPSELREQVLSGVSSFSQLKQKVENLLNLKKVDEKIDEMSQKVKTLMALVENNEIKPSELLNNLKQIEKTQQILEQLESKISELYEENKSLAKKVSNLQKENLELKELWKGVRDFASKVDNVVNKLNQNQMNRLSEMEGIDVRERVRQYLKGQRFPSSESREVSSKKIEVDSDIIIDLNEARKLAGLDKNR
ncbi:MAG: hypothetical protein QXI58_02565 [Candidatus Micrarchaeia archaeon]